ncbi:MAG TPA: membrane protein insertase YidC [Acidimicrobiales bacterium]|nr:membrane protein insertase YidC [Acidimicrobiales bacterium]
MKSFTHDIGKIFQPIYDLLGRILAFFYGLVPNYAVAIALLTLLIMGVLTPLTIKSTKSMISMQRLQPELKKLQQKYKGPENRQLLNEEMMRLYKEEGVNPLGGCLPMLLQTPFLIMLYGVIKGLANQVMEHGKLVSLPRYIPSSSTMYHNLIASGGQIKAFGMDLNLKLFSTHSSFMAQLPFVAFVLAAVGLQYFQMAQLNNRNRKTGQAMPSQQLAMQRFLPLIFAYIYMIIPAAVVLYMIISTAVRILTQHLMFVTGVSDPTKQGVQKSTHRAEIEEEHKDGANHPQVEEIPGAKPTNTEKPKAPANRPDPSKPQPQKRPTTKPSTTKPQVQSRSKAKRKRKAR